MKAIKGLLGSKKAMMAFISALTWGIGKAGLDMDTETLLPIVAPLWGYIAAQMGADWGKSKAEIENGGEPAASEPEAPAEPAE
jgi:hypothetical protein